MNISFGICLGPNFNRDHFKNLVSSIEKNFITTGISNLFEIIVIIPDNEYDDNQTSNIKYIPFDESIKKGWITKKKNIIVENAIYDNICIVHDYYIFDMNWYKGVLSHSIAHPNWDVLCNAIYRFEGDRHSDWLVNQHYMEQMLQSPYYRDLNLSQELMQNAPLENNGAKWVCGLPYTENKLTHIQYVSGGFIFARKNVFKTVKLDERYGWGEAPEDIIWSKDVIKNQFKIQFNKYSSVRLQKPHKWKVYEMPSNVVDILKEMYGKTDNGT